MMTMLQKIIFKHIYLFILIVKLDEKNAKTVQNKLNKDGIRMCISIWLKRCKLILDNLRYT